MSKNDILESALNLPIEDRIKLVETLLESYNSFDNNSIEKAWIDEVIKRAENLDTSDTLSYKDFFNQN
ncbi:MAG: addiction module protein [Aliarcobacter sp.]|nr:addiction module protein [Aliarcobacter sp.]